MALTTVTTQQRRDHSYRR